MDFQGAGPGAAAERLAAWRERVDRLADDTRAMNERLQRLRCTYCDPNRIVEVTVDAGGALVDLQFSERIGRIRPDDAARTVMETIQEAKRRVADESARVIGEAMGEGSPAGQALAERLREQLAAGAPEGRQP